jgi:hypothetical protein
LTAFTKLAARLGRFPPATATVAIERDVPASMPDGAVLLADRYYPVEYPNAPIVLIRTPYGRRGPSAIFGRLFAERGYQCVIQSCRGTFGSGGTFTPFVHEAEDGKATLAWMAEQPWFTGRVFTWGPSYLGYTQWAVAADAPPFVEAMAPQVTAAHMRGVWYPDDVFALDTSLSWVHSVSHQEERGLRMLRNLVRQRSDLAPAFATLPLNESDRVAVGDKVSFFQEYLESERADAPVWQDIDVRATVGVTRPRVAMLAGWYDIFLVDQLADHAALQDAGRAPWLTIGPWIHASPGGFLIGFRDTLDLFGGRRRELPVHVCVMGKKRWVDLPSWPPATTSQTYHLHPGRRLDPSAPPESAPDTYLYDPADPTPSIGGRVLGGHAGRKENGEIESRADVLTYTTEPLRRDVTIMGRVDADLYVRSSAASTDWFVRLCDVTPKGKSFNVCDGIVRTTAPERVSVALSPTAYCFRRGHRIRVQVSSGAHPRWARNLGTGEPIATGVAMRTARQEVLHDPEHPSAITVGVWQER